VPLGSPKPRKLGATWREQSFPQAEAEFLAEMQCFRMEIQAILQHAIIGSGAILQIWVLISVRAQKRMCIPLEVGRPQPQGLPSSWNRVLDPNVSCRSGMSLAGEAYSSPLMTGSSPLVALNRDSFLNHSLTHGQRIGPVTP
jgi:hypothetical protein